MGLGEQKAVKKDLRARFGKIFKSMKSIHLVSSDDVSVVHIVDMPGVTMRHGCHKGTLDELSVSVVTTVDNLFKYRADTSLFRGVTNASKERSVHTTNIVVLVFDKIRYVPESKKPIQAERMKTSKKMTLQAIKEMTNNVKKYGKLPDAKSWSCIKQCPGLVTYIEEYYIERLKNNAITGDDGVLIIDPQASHYPIIVRRNRQEYEYTSNMIMNSKEIRRKSNTTDGGDTMLTLSDINTASNHPSMNDGMVGKLPKDRNPVGEYDECSIFWMHELVKRHEKDMPRASCIDIILHSSDSDMIPIATLYVAYFLLPVRYLSDLHGRKNANVYLYYGKKSSDARAGTRTYKAPVYAPFSPDSEVIDVNMFVVMLRNHFTMTNPKMTYKFPILNFMFLLVATGGDYNKKLFPGISNGIFSLLLDHLAAPDDTRTDMVYPYVVKNKKTSILTRKQMLEEIIRGETRIRIGYNLPAVSVIHNRRLLLNSSITLEMVTMYKT